MFAKATKNFVKEVDCGGNLIPVSSLNNLDKLEFLNLVTKRKKTWCWQTPKYHLLSVTLNDVLVEGEGDPVKPVIVESDFVKYEGKFKDYIRGSIETSLGNINLGTGGSGIVESQSSFGNLKKQEADLQKLMKDVKGRTINLQTTLLQQMLERKHVILCILTEKILTTKKCLISEHIQREEKLAGMVQLSTKIIKVSASENGNLLKDSNVVLEIPAPTAIAYGVIELYIKRDGHFDFCLLHDQQGGFDRKITEEPSDQSLPFNGALFPQVLDMVDETSPAPESPVPVGASINSLSKDVLPLKAQFQPFVTLPEEKKRAFYQMVCDLLLHEDRLMQLEDMLDSVCSEGSPEILVKKELKSPEEQCLEEFLQLVGVHIQSRQLTQKDPLHKEDLLLAVHLLLSAMTELSSYSLVLLRACCDLQLVSALSCLLNMISEDGTVTLLHPMLTPLADPGRFCVAQKLFALSDINLEMTETSIKASIMKKTRFSPLILYIALHGLHALGYKITEN